MSIYHDLDSLARTVLEIDEKVKDYMQVAAILEAVGISSETVEGLGYPSLFDLAKDVMKVIEHYRNIGEVWGEIKPTKLQRLIEAFKLFVFGVLFSAPWLLITISYMLFGISLLPVYEEPLKATAIDMSMILSILITSILPPMFMRRLQFHFYQEDYSSSQKILALYYIIGSLLVISSAAIIWLIFQFSDYPAWWSIYMLIYFIPFSLFWLSVAPLYAFQRYVALAASYITSLVFIGIMYRFFEKKFAVELIHVYGVILGAFFATIYSISILYIRHKILGISSEPTIPPKFPFILYPGITYSLAQTLYFILIFTDRFLVWSMTNPLYPLLANLDYEKAANLSLLVLVAPFGVLNYHLTKLYQDISRVGERILVKDLEKFRSTISRRYKIACISILIFGVISLLSLLCFFRWIGWLPTEFYLKVFVFSGIAYVLIPLFFIGWLLGTYLYRPEKFLKPLAISVSINVITGLVLTRFFGAEYASVSFMVSIAILSVMSLISSMETVRRIDYAYYSAF